MRKDPVEYEYLITEVKNSTRQETIRTGIKETLEYLAFLRVNEDYVFGREETTQPDYFGSGWNGLLVVQVLDQPTQSLSEQSGAGQEIKILQASELDDGLTTLLKKLLST